MRRWFELGELEDTTYSDDSGDKVFLQLPQKEDFIKWANSMVGVYTILRKITGAGGDVGLCAGQGVNPGDPHVIVDPPNVSTISIYGEMRAEVMFQGVPPVYQGLCRFYSEKPGINDGPNDTQTVEKPRGGSSGGKGGGNIVISLKSYLLLLLNTWQSGVVGNVPQRWIEWLTLLISHYSRYTPTQIYGFLARVDFAGPTFKV
jgi:hypothetical protein